MGQCWKSGYGYVRHGKVAKMEGAHGYIYRLYKGDFDPKLNVLHICDIPICVNPNNLYLGTHSDNMKDRYKRDKVSQKDKLNGNYKHEKYIKNKDI